MSSKSTPTSKICIILAERMNISVLQRNKAKITKTVEGNGLPFLITFGPLCHTTQKVLTGCICLHQWAQVATWTSLLELKTLSPFRNIDLIWNYTRETLTNRITDHWTKQLSIFFFNWNRKCYFWNKTKTILGTRPKLFILTGSPSTLPQKIPRTHRVLLPSSQAEAAPS